MSSVRCEILLEAKWKPIWSGGISLPTLDGNRAEEEEMVFLLITLPAYVLGWVYRGFV